MFVINNNFLATNRITKINFRFGERPGDTSLEVDVSDKNLVILVGPAGAGKTKSLTDIFSLVTPSPPTHVMKFVTGVDFDFPKSFDEVMGEIQPYNKAEEENDEVIILERQLEGKFGTPSGGVRKDSIKGYLESSNECPTDNDKNPIYQTLGLLSTGYIKLTNRLNMCNLDDVDGQYYPQILFNNSEAITKAIRIHKKTTLWKVLQHLERDPS